MTAYTFCKRNDMELATLEDTAAAAYLMQLFMIYKKEFGVTGALLGAMAYLPSSRTEWYWINRGMGKKLNFPMLWHEDEPNNKAGNEYCLEVSVRRSVRLDSTTFHVIPRPSFKIISSASR